MALKRRNLRKIDFNSSSMSDLVFLLLIFFMLTSTLVAPNAIKLLLPKSNSKTMAKQTVDVTINMNHEYLVNGKVVTESELEPEIEEALGDTPEGTVVVSSDKDVPVQLVVNVIDAVNDINNAKNQSFKVLLRTSPKK